MILSKYCTVFVAFCFSFSSLIKLNTRLFKSWRGCTIIVVLYIYIEVRFKLHKDSCLYFYHFSLSLYIYIYIYILGFFTQFFKFLHDKKTIFSYQKNYKFLKMWKKEKKNLSLILFLISLVNETNKYLIYLTYGVGFIKTIVPHKHGTLRTMRPLLNHSRTTCLYFYHLSLSLSLSFIYIYIYIFRTL